MALVLLLGGLLGLEISRDSLPRQLLSHFACAGFG